MYDVQDAQLQDLRKTDMISKCIVSQRERENNEVLKECNIKEREWGADKLLSLIPFVSVKGCDCVTFPGINPASSFLLIMQEPIRSRVAPVSASG